MSNDNKLRNVMMEAHSLCPTDMSHIKRMAWMADYFVQHSALPAEKPAAAAERGAVGLTVWKGDVAELAVQHGIYHEPDEEDVQAFAKAVLAAATINATPPAQAAEPAQVDEVVGIAETIRSELERLRNFTPPVSGLWDELYANVEGRIDELVAALTQRPAAPLATDAGAEHRMWDSQWVNVVNSAWVLEDDSVYRAVKLTEQAMAENIKRNSWPPARKEGQK